MKKRYIPLILTLIAVAGIFGLSFGAQQEAGHQADLQTTQRHLSTTIAVVNGDSGIMVNGGLYNYSAAIINTLGDDFVLVSPAMAQTGFANGVYAAVVTFPSNVSARVLSFNAMEPERVQLEFQINPNLPEQDYLETFMAITELQLAINTTLASTYVSSILQQFHYAQDQVHNIFQNNLADLLALEIITLGDFTANLALDDVPFVPIQPRELDTPFYMTQVRAFAEEVANWYLHSYAMASNQFLWMREGLIRLTDNFPYQEEDWVHMMMAWTNYSTFYGELLDIFFEDVSLHEDDLRDWHLETFAWHNALALYQTQVLNWHNHSNEWLWSAEDWHMDYTDFLHALREYGIELNTHHGLLDDSLQPVLNDLDAWREALQEYERMLRVQYLAIRSMVDDHDNKAGLTNAFLGQLSTWYAELHTHHSTMRHWYQELHIFHEALDSIQYQLTEALDVFWEVMYYLPPVPEDLPHYGLPPLPYIEPVPTVATASALSLAILPDLAEMAFDDILWDLWDLAWSVDWLAEDIDFLATDIEEALGELESIHIAPVVVHLPAIPTVPSGVICVNASWPPSHFMATTYAAISVHFGCEFCNFMAQLNDVMNTLNSDVEAIVERLNDHYIYNLNAHVSTVTARGEQLASYTNQLQAYAAENLTGYIYRLENHIHTVENYADTVAYGAELLFDWYLDLQESIFDIYFWYSDMVIFHNEAETLYHTVQASIDTLQHWHVAAIYLEEDLSYITIPDLPCVTELEYVANLSNASRPHNPRELEMAELIPWDEDISQPSPYEGAEIYEVFDVDFPLDFNTIAEVVDLYRPPVLTGYDVPMIVDEHFMIFAYRPESPMIPPPPRPDNFWSSLNLMHDQLLSFNVDDFLSDDIHMQVERSLASYEAYLESIRGDLTYLFQDNIWLMHDVNATYNHFLHNLRHDALTAAAYEQYALQNAIETFTTLREINNANTISRLGAFANMMPESRAIAGVNQGLVNFAVMPFDFAPTTIRDEMVFEQPESVVDMFVQWQWIAMWVLGVVVLGTVLGVVGLWFVQRKRHSKEATKW